MFQSDMTKASSGCIKIKEIKQNVLSSLTMKCYTKKGRKAEIKTGQAKRKENKIMLKITRMIKAI